MSRKIFFGTDTKVDVSDEVMLKIYELSEQYNKKYFNESNHGIFLDKYSYYLNWSVYKDDLNPLYLYEVISGIKQILFKKGLNKIQILKMLKNANLIIFNNTERLVGSTRIDNNEFLARIAIKYILEISNLLPDQIFYFEDEGYYIYCPLEIMNMKARPKLSSLKPEFEYLVGTNEITSKLIYYNYLINQPNEFVKIDNFIRPFKSTANKKFNKNNKLHKKLNFEEIEQYLIQESLNELTSPFEFYDDIDQYPNVL